MTVFMKQKDRVESRLKDPGSAITHFIGLVASIVGAIPLLSAGFHRGGGKTAGAVLLFLFGLILLYGASTLYHSIDSTVKRNCLLRKMDHSMIYVLIAGTYSPICILTLPEKTGYILFAVIWSMAVLGILQAFFWITCPKWVSSVIYMAMGWTCIAIMPILINSMNRSSFYWLIGGGVFYTTGAIIYALKLRVFNELHHNFGSHEIFHLFCLGGSLCHYIMMIYLI